MEKLRKDIADKDKWDLTKIYKSDNAFEKDLDVLKEDIKTLDKNKGHILDNAKTLYETLNYFDLCSRKLSKLANYAMRNNDADTSNSKYQEYVGQIMNVSSEMNIKTSYYNAEMLKGDYSLCLKYEESEPRLKVYDLYFKDLYKNKKHALSEKEDKLLSTLSVALDTSMNTFDTLNDTDLDFGKVRDDNGKLVKLTHGNYGSLMESTNRKVRKDTFKRTYKTYKSVNNTLNATLAGMINYNVAYSKIHKYPSALEEAMDESDLDVSIYNNLVNTVNKHLDTMYKYLDLRKEVLGLDELHMYDMYSPLVATSTNNYSFIEAKQLVLDALSIYGNDYTNNLKKAFNEGWIDIYPNKYKRSGAYSSGSYDTNPYLLLNFDGKLNDVSTLAHELGHSMHTYYSNKANPYPTSGYTIFVAEIASTVNELLLAHYMLEHAKNRQDKLVILNQLMELYKGTLYRQTMFAEFEKEIYEKVESGKVLTAQSMNKDYYKLVKKYFGQNVNIDKDIQYEWSRIPHFYYDFYVYKYATSISIASTIVQSLLNGDQKMLKQYLNFLTLGSSMHPLDELKTIDIDMSDSKVIENAIMEFDHIIDEFKKVYEGE